MEQQAAIPASIPRAPPAPGAVPPASPARGVPFAACLASADGQGARAPDLVADAPARAAGKPVLGKPSKPSRAAAAEAEPNPASPPVPVAPIPDVAVPPGKPNDPARVKAGASPSVAPASPGDKPPKPDSLPASAVLDVAPPGTPMAVGLPMSPPTMPSPPMAVARTDHEGLPALGMEGAAIPAAGVRAGARPQAASSPSLPAGDGVKPREPGAEATFPVAALLAPAPVAPRASPVAPSGANPPASAPTEQVIPAMLSVASGAAGPVLTLHLNPGELGAIRVTLERDASGAAGVTLMVERPETMRLLRGDMAHLHAALDMAGVAQAGRTLSLHMHVPDAAAPAMGGGPGLGASSPDGGNRGGARQPAGSPRQPGSSHDTGIPLVDLPRHGQWSRAGIDITA